MTESPLKRLQTLGFQLPVPAAPAGAYVPVVRTGNLLFVSGQLSVGPDGLVKGLLGSDLDVKAGQVAAAYCALNILGQIVHQANVPMEQIARLVKLTVLVASTPSFIEQHLVANGASELFVAALSPRGQHARAAFGVASLPLGAAVEIEAVVEVTD